MSVLHRYNNAALLGETNQQRPFTLLLLALWQYQFCMSKKIVLLFRPPPFIRFTASNSLSMTSELYYSQKSFVSELVVQ